MDCLSQGDLFFPFCKTFDWIREDIDGKGLGLRTVPTNTEVFYAVYNHAENAGLSKRFWNPFFRGN